MRAVHSMFFFTPFYETFLSHVTWLYKNYYNPTIVHLRMMSAYGCLATLRNVKLSCNANGGLNETIACSISLSQVVTTLHSNGECLTSLQ